MSVPESVACQLSRPACAALDVLADAQSAGRHASLSIGSMCEAAKRVASGNWELEGPWSGSPPAGSRHSPSMRTGECPGIVAANALAGRRGRRMLAVEVFIEVPLDAFM